MEITIMRIHLQCENAEGFRDAAPYNNSMSYTTSHGLRYAKIDDNVIESDV